jgi:cytochrome c oxidase assembly factor CtaG
MAYTTRRVYPARFSSFRARIIGITSRIAVLMLIVALLVTAPASVLAATTDPVLEWIAIMNTTVIAGALVR